MDSDIRYVSGVTNTVDVATTVEPVYKDTTVGELFEEYMSLCFTNSVNSWEFEAKVIEYIQPLYCNNNLKRWFSYQLNDNPFVYGMTEDFLIDTLTFINTGKREMSLINWMSLVQPQPTKTSTRFSKPFAEDYLGRDSTALWLSRPQGFGDYITTAKILFSAANKVEVNKYFK